MGCITCVTKYELIHTLKEPLGTESVNTVIEPGTSLDISRRSEYI
jgi:hypothetical protein